MFSKNSLSISLTLSLSLVSFLTFWSCNDFVTIYSQANDSKINLIRIGGVNRANFRIYSNVEVKGLIMFACDDCPIAFLLKCSPPYLLPLSLSHTSNLFQPFGIGEFENTVQLILLVDSYSRDKEEILANKRMIMVYQHQRLRYRQKFRRIIHSCDAVHVHIEFIFFSLSLFGWETGESDDYSYHLHIHFHCMWIFAFLLVS